MAQGKQSPRQKMINLMYLVFIAMLSMQIDQGIVKSFYDTQNSLTETRSLTDAKNQVFEANLAEKAQNSTEDQEKLQNYTELKGFGDDLVKTIDGLKGTIVKESGFVYNEKDFNYNAANNSEPATKLFFQGGDENKPSAEATNLMNKINALRTFIVQKFTGKENFENVIARAQKNLVTDKKYGKTWLQNKFYNQPMVAALSNLEILQTEVRNIQSDVLSIYLQGKSVIAVPNSTLVTQTPVNATPMTSNHKEDHKEDFTKTKTQDYTANISAGTVLYQGFPNPVSIDGAGAGTQISASGASVTSAGAGKWIVTPGPVDEVTLSVGGKNIKYMVKKLPPVVGTVRGKSAVAMPASSIKNQTVSVDMPGFVYPVSFTVTGFKVKVPGKPTAIVSGNSLSEVANMFTNLRQGDKVTIMDIEVTATGMGNSIPKTPSNITINVTN